MSQIYRSLIFAVLVPQAQRGDSRAVNSLLLGFTPMVRAFKYNSYYVHYLEQDDTEILALMAVNDAIKSFKQHNFRFFCDACKIYDPPSTKYPGAEEEGFV